MAGPSDAEQLLLEYINETRLDPLGSAARYLTSYAPLTATDGRIQAALDYFHVDGAALLAAYRGLAPVQPLAWNDNLAAGARLHDQVMIDTQTQTHQAPGELDLGGRATAAGYAGWNRLGENVYAYSENTLYAHAGFMVDWGNGPDGMQSPAGHRVNLMNGAYTEVGIGILTETNPNTPVGPQVVTEDFGTRAAAPRFVLGVAYSDRDGNDFYSPGEGRGDLSVAVGAGVATSYATGGYQLAAGQGATVTLAGGGLAGAVTVRLVSAQNVKIDVVDGTELKVSGSVVIAGPVATIEGVGSAGVAIAIGDALGHRILGAGGPDSLVGAAGADDIFGGDGADTLHGGDGNDHLYGRGSAGADGGDLIYGGNGSDYLQGNAGADTMDGGTGSDRVYGGADGDLLIGGAGNDTMVGAAGHDTLSGGDDNDSLRGGAGDDLVQGGAGNDVVLGSQGDDVLVGGGGVDLATGGPGADLFRFAPGDAAFAVVPGALAAWTADAVTDFVHGEDHVVPGFAVAAVLHAAAQPDMAAALAQAQALLLGAPGDHQLAAVAVGGDSYLFFGATGGDAVDSAIRLAGIDATTISVADFI